MGRGKGSSRECDRRTMILIKLVMGGGKGSRRGCGHLGAWRGEVRDLLII